jgi:hypothetical protein
MGGKLPVGLSIKRRMVDDWARRRTALGEGVIYRVMREAPSFPKGSHFNVGEEVRLRHVGYSPYDTAHFYTFRVHGGAEKSFWLHDDEPLERLTQTFAS